MTNTDNPTSRALATRDERAERTPAALVTRSRDKLAEVMPSHVRPDQWLRVTQGALRKGQRSQTDPSLTLLEEAAMNNPLVFMQTVAEAARLGLEPGTEQFYLTPRKVKGRWEILGIVGYQGFIELMYRAGMVSSVVAELVYSGDEFRFNPGTDLVPHHVIDWDAEDRGTLRLVYAFARMRGGATSKVVVMNARDIAAIRAKSASARSDHSPWNTDEPAMWLKSAVRQLRKWVPTSTEYRGDMATTSAPPLEFVPSQSSGRDREPMTAPALSEGAEPVDYVDVMDDEDVEVLDDDTSPGVVDPIDDADVVDVHPEPGPGDTPAKPLRPLPTADESGAPLTITQAQTKRLHGLLRTKRRALGPARFDVLAELLDGLVLTSTSDLTPDQAQRAIDLLAAEPDADPEDGGQ